MAVHSDDREGAVLLIIVVQEQRFDGDDLVVLLLLHLHIRIDGLQAGLDGIQRLGGGHGLTFLYGKRHLRLLVDQAGAIIERSLIEVDDAGDPR